MSNRTSEFTPASSLLGSEIFGFVQGGNMRRGTYDELMYWGSNRVFNVLKYGAVGDLRTVKDAVLNATTTITSATAAFTTLDEGKKILVNEQLLTIVTRSSATTIIVSSAVGASGSGKTIRWCTDRTTHVQDALNDCAASGGGDVYFPRQALPLGIAGPLQTVDNNGFAINCQIFIPSRRVPYQGGTDKPIYIRLIAETPPSQVESAFIDVGSGDYNYGTMVQSILPYSMATGTRPAVFGIGGYADVFGSFTFTEITVQNMWIRHHHHVGNGSYMTCCDFTNSTNTIFEQNRGDFDVSAPNSVVPSTVNFGFMGPKSNGGTVNSYRNNLVVGHYSGYSAGEHSLFLGGQAMCCVHPVDFQKAGHVSRGYGFTVHWCRDGFKYNLWDNGYSTNFHVVNMLDVTIERASLGKWYDTQKDVTDTVGVTPGSDLGLRGNLTYAISGAAGISKNGGANWTCKFMGDAL